MARNNIERVPPPTKWPLRFQVTQDVLDKPAELANSFPTFEEAMVFLKGQPAATNPWNGIPWTGEVSPGDYAGKIWIPNNVFLHSPNPLSVIINGGADVLAGESIVSVANGGLRNFWISPKNLGGVPLASLLVRDSLALYTDEDYDWVGSLSGKTLIFLTPSVTITFTGTEVDAPSVAAKIIADGGGLVTAQAISNRVVIQNTTPASPLKIDKDGTSNIILGFFDDFDLESIPNDMEFMVAQNLVVVGSSGQEKVVYLTDQSNGQYVIDGITTAGGTVGGIYAEQNSQAIIRSAFPFLSGAGIYVADYAHLELEGGRSDQNIGDDVHVEEFGKLSCRGFSYTTRTPTGSGAGTLVPSGARSPEVFNVAGAYAVSSEVDGIRTADFESVIESVTMTRKTAGVSGQTEIQLNKVAPGGAVTPLYTTTAQPAITAAQGNYVMLKADLPDILKIEAGYSLTVDITEKEVGNPQGLNIKVRTAVTSAA